MSCLPRPLRVAPAAWPTVLLLALLLPTALHAQPAPAQPAPPRPAPAAPVALPPSGAVRPVPGRLVRPFQPPPTPYAAGHRGVDLAAEPAEPVVAALGGQVTFAGQVALVGWVTIQHGGGLSTTYGDIMPAVAAGQQVGTGEVIGHVTQRALHLDWGAKLDRAYLDPLLLLRAWRLARAHPADVPRGRLQALPP